MIINGRGERIRTSDPLLPKQVRYQTALRPETSVEVVCRILKGQVHSSGKLLEPRCLLDGLFSLTELADAKISGAVTVPTPDCFFPVPTKGQR